MKHSQTLSLPTPTAGIPAADKHAEVLAGVGIKTVRDLGINKYFATAGVLVALSNHVD